MATNLLPPTQKQELKTEKLRQKIIFILFLILADLLLLMAIIFGLYVYVSKTDSNLNKEIIQREQLLKDPQSQEIKKTIEIANQDLYKINSVKKEQVSAVSILEKLNTLFPSTAYLKSFSFQNSVRDVKDKLASTTQKEFFGKINLSGLASNREVVLSFKKSLSQELSFQDVYFNPSSWVKSVNADFITEFNFVPVKK
ncbi:MAG: hypothetical protein Q7R99_04420 [bacterium]|nr:hypothetical protein [bacterium]